MCDRSGKFRLLCLLAMMLFVAGCGGGSPTAPNTAPSEKQKQKEGPQGGPGSGGYKSK
jgi:hypothetical protein